MIAFIIVNECEVNNGPCEHICADTFTSFECSCEDGYELNTDGRTCNGKLVTLCYVLWVIEIYSMQI